MKVNAPPAAFTVLRLMREPSAPPRKTITLKKLDLLQIAILGEWLDDPYGDGIRLERIRNPSPARQAALDFIRGEPQLGGEALIREQYEERVRACFDSRGRLPASIRSNVPRLDRI